ncbi:MAG: hypothetical protein U0638_10270 [Phycisphaerales bacterium]
MTSVQPPADKPGFRFDPRLAAGVLAVLALCGVGMWFLFRHLASLDNSPAEHQRIGTPLFAGAVACFIGCVASARMSFPGSKAALVLAALAVVCWIAPTPFGITRLLSYVCIGALAARHLVGAIASCRCVPSPDVAADPATLRRGRERRRAAWISVVGVITGGVGLLLLIKADALGWAAAID